ncbi:MAG: hypothetical protein K2W91_04685 [Novosphingobium sp.]|nr:hypothetical protein [Novosphingobium sp.]
MASDIEIAKAVAARIGTSARITSLNDNTTLARTLKGVWDAQRKAVLRDGSWNFATVTRELAALDPATLESGAVPYPWSTAFALPGDCLRLLELLDSGSRGSFEKQSDAVHGDVILCNAAAPLVVRIVVDRPIERFDDVAADAFALRLAWRCGRKIAGSAFDLDQCWAEYRRTIGSAKGVDAKEGPPIPNEESAWILSRQTGRW